MEWVKLVAVPAYYHDGALLRAGEAAEVLFCRALAHCGSVESRGVVDKTVLPLLVPSKPQVRADALVREGLWLDEGAHYRIRSWDKWQDQHDVAAEKRRKDRERQRDHRRRMREQESQDNTVTPSQSKSRDSHSDNRDGHNVDVDVEREEEKSRPRKRATPTPDDLPITEAMRAWGRSNCPHVADPDAETAQFLDYHRGKGSSQKDWPATWRTWMRNAERFAQRNAPAAAAEDPWWMRRGGAAS